ncbi:MAG: sigma-70 family RNA polymerase sigma factor [Pseudomonadota bacterium]
MSDDQTIVRRALDGQPGAFDLLVSRHERLVWHIVLRMTGSEADAADLVQEVFLCVFRKLAQYRFDASLATWIGRIAYSVAVRFLERKRPTAANLDLDELAGSEAEPHRLAERSDAQATVELALEALPPVPRTIVSLYHLRGLDLAEIARLTDLPVGTVKSHLHRARRRMRQLLETMGKEHDNP